MAPRLGTIDGFKQPTKKFMPLLRRHEHLRSASAIAFQTLHRQPDTAAVLDDIDLDSAARASAILEVVAVGKAVPAEVRRHFAQNIRSRKAKELGIARCRDA